MLLKKFFLTRIRSEFRAIASLRKKIHDHGNSLSHKKAQEILLQQDENIIVKKIDEVTSARVATTSRVFNTAYKIAKLARPFTDHTAMSLYK